MAGASISCMVMGSLSVAVRGQRVDCELVYPSRSKWEADPFLVMPVDELSRLGYGELDGSMFMLV